ncbi:MULTISPECIES: hypothetical protein [unclassified Wolbachia]|uniref:hypothetical protein n=1 Tax=unclassified Wolbachia TaxID=2640676 RepID=UPI0012936454|nr:hypothetical protein [Wolbachia endosymbiont of Nasonia oneida]
MRNAIRNRFIALVSLIHILVAIMILSKASADTYCRQKVPFTLSGIEVQQLQQIAL